MPDSAAELDLLRSRLASMEQLFEVHERTAREQSERLEQTLAELRARAEEAERARGLAERAQGEAERWAERMRFLAEADMTLAGSLDYEKTLSTVARLAVPNAADGCVVDLVSDSRALRRLVVAHVDPAMVEIVQRLEEQYLLSDDPRSPVKQVLRTGEPFLLSRTTPEVTDPAAPDAEHLRILDSLGLGSVIIVPLQTRGMAFGVLTLIRSLVAPAYTPLDLNTAQELAQRAGAAIENARLVRELERTQQHLEQTASELEAHTEELQNTVEELESTTHDLLDANEGLSVARADAERARHAAEEANTAKSQFLATMSHELRTPLNAIDGYAELMELGIHGPITELQREALNRIRRAQKRLLSLVNSVLSFAKVEAGQILFEYASVPLEQLIANVELVVAPQVAAKELELAIDRFDPSIALHADPEKAEQILLNLIGNALKFTPSGGEIRIGAERDGAMARIHVSDTGVGIPADRLQSVFEPFVQVSGGMVRDQGGVGLGLAISRDLARCMSGDLYARSAPGKGSRFTLSLPLASRATDTTAADPDEWARLRHSSPSADGPAHTITMDPAGPVDPEP